MTDITVTVLVTAFSKILTSTNSFVKNHKAFSADISAMRIRLEVAHHRVQSYTTFLFGQPPFSEGGTYAILPEKTKHIALEMVLELFSALEKYRETEEAYAHPVQGSGPKENAPLFVPEELRDVIGVGAAAQAKPDSTWWKKAKWAMSGKKRLEALVERIEGWNSRIWSVIQDVVWMQVLTVEQAEMIAESEEARELQFAWSARMRALILGGVSGGNQMLIAPLEFRTQAAIEAGTSHTMKAGKFKGDPVLFEFKNYKPDSSGRINEDTEAQICRLISLLRQQVDAGSRILPCRHGYYTDYAESRFVIMYDAPSGKLPQPITLTSVLEPTTSGNVRPSITSRFRLAHRLAESLYLLHTVGWVHKNLNGESILFFKPEESSGDGATTNSVYDTPYIVGFEYSRPESDATSNRAEWRIEKNIYRHWDRWGEPTARSSKIHDIYALGVLLLEIGLWRSARSTSRDGFTSREGDPIYVRDSLRKMLRGKLAFAMGEKYEKIVRLCLEGSEKAFMEGSGDETDISLHKAFRESVVEVLKVSSESV